MLRLNSELHFYLLCGYEHATARFNGMHSVPASSQWRTEGGEVGVFNTPLRNSEVLTKSNLTANCAENVSFSYSSTLISLKIAEFRTPTPQDVQKKGSKILKPPRFAIVLHLR